MTTGINDAMRGIGVAVVIVAGGSGSRMSGGDAAALPKQFLPLAGVPVLVRTLRGFLDALPAAEFIVALPAEYIAHWEGLCREWKLAGMHRVCAGGANRFESVRNALVLADGCRWIAVHDGVRPLFTAGMVLSTLATAMDFGTAVPVVEPVDSFRMVGACGSQAVDRSLMRAVQTPQIFAADVLREAYRQPYDPAFTDDASAVERAGYEIRLCTGERRNIKITSPEDMTLARAWLGE